MASSSRLSALRTAFKTALTDRGNLSGVAVSKFKPAPDDINGVEHIWFQDAEGLMDHASPSSRFDDIALVVVIRVAKPGGDETAAAAAEDRALALFAEVEAVVASDTTFSSVILGTNPGRYRVDHDTTNGDRICTIEAEVTFMTQIDNA